MNLKQPRVFVILPLLALAGAAAILAVSCSKGSISAGSGSGSGYLCNAETNAVCAPPPATTFIASCVVDAQNDVVIGPGTAARPGCATVVMEPSATNPSYFGAIDVQSGGTLLVTGKPSGSMATTAPGASTIPAATLETPTLEICVENGGTVKYGTAGNPITSSNKVVLQFRGNPGDKPTGGSTCAKEGFLKGIEVLAGGTLEMYGAKGVPARGGVSWTTLAKPAGPPPSGVATGAGTSSGPSTLYLTADVTKGAEGWQPGDWIVVATSNFVPFDTEFVQIQSVTSGSNGVKGAGSWVTLMQPLQYYHFGSLAPSSASATCPDPLDASKTQPKFLCDGASQNYGVDERAEVGLISRDITLTAATATIVPPASTTDPTHPDRTTAIRSEHWGGEIKIVKGFKKVAIQGVRLSKFGKAQLGSYPIHFHKAGVLATSPSPALIDADSVDHSYNKCVTIHETSNLTISNMVCARIVGHIFYEELGDDGTSNVADDSGITFENDLGLGAMSNSFDIYGVDVQAVPTGTIPPGSHDRQYMIEHYWWTGDNCAADPACIGANGYDGFNIPDTDNQLQQVHGSCYTYGTSLNGWLQNKGDPGTGKSCASGRIYDEPASGFWIQNPATNLIGDAIGGCQGVGSGFWWVTPQNQIKNGKKDVSLFYEKMGTIRDDRAHACYNGFFNDGTPGNINNVSPLSPHQETKNDSPSVIATLDDVTATRNRFRGLWLRTSWFVVTNSHFATNRDNVSLLTSGGIDGNAPGAWNLLEDSALIGLSENNPGRWGPCPYQQSLTAVSNGTPVIGSEWGCIDYIPSSNLHSGDIFDTGYQSPKWNTAGYYLYDGPALVFHDRFINFNHNEGWYTYFQKNGKAYPCPTSSTPSQGAYYNELDDADCAFVRAGDIGNAFNAYGKTPPAPYEGDAALGWFNSNQNSYPTGTASKQLMFVNTNLRHQVFTEFVGLGGFFNDGDKNTSIIDEDGTLDGFGVQRAPNSGTNPVHPISLNNLPFNGTSNSVDECLSRGAQDKRYEGRTSALMSSASMGTLQFSSLYPWTPQGQVTGFPGGDTTHWQAATFTRTDALPDGNGGSFRPTMVMQTGRNGLGSFEPKVSNGYGYYVTVSKSNAPASISGDNAGLYKWIDITLADVVDPNITTAHPFYIRLGIDYKSTTVDGKTVQPPPPDASYFTIKRGYKSYYNSTTWLDDPQLQNYWTKLDCTNLDASHPANLPTDAQGGKGYCPAASGPATAPVPVSVLSAATNIGALTNTDGTPNLKKYYYDPTTGYLWLNIVQDEPNPIGPSPTGSCDSTYDGGNPDPACPDSTTNPESYYACPKNGCMDYTIAVKSDSTYTYTPGPSTGQPSQSDLTAMAPPAASAQNQLVLYGTHTIVTRQIHQDTTPQKVPYYTATNAPNACTITQPQP